MQALSDDLGQPLFRDEDGPFGYSGGIGAEGGRDLAAPLQAVADAGAEGTGPEWVPSFVDDTSGRQVPRLYWFRGHMPVRATDRTVKVTAPDAPGPRLYWFRWALAHDVRARRVVGLVNAVPAVG